ncbi:MAG: hypothetical protein Q8S96_00905 [Hydrogenophaga sp.]|jgi:hypothetical protein|uniref:hypothetical protein n=1 Tax=Hydrogenophaga sp. TaxID=1904254 RepID=UPI0027335F87|nr:hypothetical protein [Hydrogenophaga sp.]MDP3343005.1 hypothetical protein [Hydrogenophaga sp.]
MLITNPDTTKAQEQWLQHNSFAASLPGTHGRWTAVSPGVLIGPTAARWPRYDGLPVA